MPEKDITKFTDNQVVGGLISFITFLFGVVWYFIRRTILNIEEKIKDNNKAIEETKKQARGDFDFFFKWTGDAFEKIAQNIKQLEDLLSKELDKNNDHIVELYTKSNNALQICAVIEKEIEIVQSELSEIKKNCRENMEKEIEARFKKRD